ncbi:hypothetical protein PsorP6_005625 [Peronosclerospora sorghi]|uniref:Uncharacterized protein n=1 Tax=Peronosclerospora sorghi TaxID=230839 RepID=A0ACC0W4Y4_9STRA|nr:hypothetical protein PsorP6_005625 [Peronosclerospora sorghi]
MTDYVFLPQGLTFEVMASTFEETLPKEEFSSPAEYAMETAKEKALEVFRRVARDTASGGVQRPTLVIGCDTIVVHDGVILEKPRDEDDAFDMLTKLSKDPHDVFSGVALFSTTRGMDKPHVFFEHTSLVFGSLEPEDIRGDVDERTTVSFFLHSS